MLKNLSTNKRKGSYYAQISFIAMLICMYVFPNMILSTEINAATTQPSLNSSKQVITQATYLNFDSNNYVDWMHFAKDRVNDVYRKVNTITQNQIVFNGVGKGTTSAPTKERALDYGYYCSWTNAQPASTATNTHSSVYYPGEGSYYEITVPGKTGAKRTLEVYMGNYSSQIDVTATIGSVTYPVEGIPLNNALEKYKYTFEYTADDTSNLVVRFSLKQGQDKAWCNLGVAALTLSEVDSKTDYALPVEYLNNQDINVKLDNNNVVDWIHCNATTPNRKAGTATNDQLNLTYNGTAAGYGHTIGSDGAFLVSYNNGTPTTTATSSKAFSQFSGLDSYYEITAPSKSGVERILNIYMGSWAAKQVTVTAKLGTKDIPVDNFTTTTKQTKYAKYSLEYTGTAANEDLVVRFTLTDNSLDTLWSSIILSCVEMLEGAATVQKSINFTSPALRGTDAVIAPASGYSKRRITAKVYDQGNTYNANCRVEPAVTGVSMVDNVLRVSSDITSNATITIIAEDPNDSSVTASTTVEIVKNSTLKDTPANPIAKPGWKLFYNDEFNGNTLDTTAWSEYYLRQWTDDDNKTKADYYFENGNIVIKTDEGIKPWSFQDGSVAVKGIVSFERNHLHKFGSAHTNRQIPKFDGFATKYGYFEARFRMPNTRDGSHFAWWMTGVQDDQNITAQLAGQNTYAGHYANETAEFDIVENHIDVLAENKNWKIPIHPNGTTDLAYQYLTATTIPGDPTNEFHIYGFEWDENGTKFYLDNQLVATSDRTPNYRMMTFFNVYAQAGFGNDRGIYPKEALIDYFRVYKKDEPSKTSSIVLNNGESPNFIKVPSAGSNSVQMTATVLDQFDTAYTAPVQVKWKLSQTIDGFTPTTSASATLSGVSIDGNTGVITVNSGASTNQNIFVTAYVNDKVKQTKHIRLSSATEVSERVIFDNPQKTVTAGQTLNLSAQIYDQYKQPMTGKAMAYQISEDITGNVVKATSGVSVDQSGNLTVASSVPTGTIIVVTAKADGKYQSCTLKVTN